jgi:hypothetical protein
LNNPERGTVSDSVPDIEQQEARAGTPKKVWQRKSEQEKKLKHKLTKYAQLKKELLAAKDSAEKSDRIRRRRRKARNLQREVLRLRLQLRNTVRAAREQAEGEPGVGTLPDFVIIGAAKGGTTFFYNLLTRHPHVESAAFKEVHYFDLLFDEGTEAYLQCFPLPRWKDGRKTITGEATPGYLFHPHAPERMAEIVPQARLITLLRNPVDLFYSSYQHRVRKGQEDRSFEQTVSAALNNPHEEQLVLRGIYVDHLLRWRRFFSAEQMLVLKSEDLFERPQDTLKRTLEFLDLPGWEPEASAFRSERNKGGYEQKIDPTIRRRLEDYFEPHNRRLYEYLGVDFGW